MSTEAVAMDQGTLRSLASSLFLQAEKVEQEKILVCQPAKTPETASQCTVKVEEPEATPSAEETRELAAVSGINPLFNSIAFDEQRENGVMAFSAFDPKMCRRVACKARNTPKDHDYETAYFVIPHDASHGLLLKCSHPKCNKMKFRYCSVCGVPVAKRNFPRRHGHGLLPQDTVLGDDEDIPAAVKSSSSDSANSGASPASAPGPLATKDTASDNGVAPLSQRVSHGLSPPPNVQPEDDGIPEKTRCGFRIPVIFPLPEDERKAPIRSNNEAPPPMQRGITSSATRTITMTASTVGCLPRSPEVTSIMGAATQKEDEKQDRMIQAEGGAEHVLIGRPSRPIITERIATGASKPRESVVGDDDPPGSVLPGKAIILSGTSAPLAVMNRNEACIVATAASPAASLLKTLMVARREPAVTADNVVNPAEKKEGLGVPTEKKGPQRAQTKLHHLLDNDSYFDEVDRTFAKQESPFECSLEQHDDISVPDDASLHDVDVNIDDVFDNADTRSSSAASENWSGSSVLFPSHQEVTSLPLSDVGAPVDVREEGVLRKRKQAEFLGQSHGQQIGSDGMVAITGDDERNSPPPGLDTTGDGDDDVIVMPVTKRERKWIKLLRARPLPGASDALKAWLGDVLRSSEPRMSSASPLTTWSNHCAPVEFCTASGRSSAVPSVSLSITVENTGPEYTLARR